VREIVEKFPYVAMDTEFPGVVAKPVTEAFTSDFHYKSLKINVDLLHIIQLGLSFADEKGNFAPVCWQFNFRFNLDGDMFAQDSIDLLVKSGISFEDHAKRGIDPLLFGELLMVSGLVLDDRVKWVTFHSGYDYGYLLKLLTTSQLPSDEKAFFELLKIYFPTIYDIKYMTSIMDGHFMGGLQKLADDLGCQRLGAEHQAGSDCMLTMSTYFALARAKFAKRRIGIQGADVGFSGTWRCETGGRVLAVSRSGAFAGGPAAFGGGSTGERFAMATGGLLLARDTRLVGLDGGNQ
jgi:CCR4-NOT transcription complex subunit 7/8